MTKPKPPRKENYPKTRKQPQVLSMRYSKRWACRETGKMLKERLDTDWLSEKKLGVPKEACKCLWDAVDVLADELIARGAGTLPLEDELKSSKDLNLS